MRTEVVTALIAAISLGLSVTAARCGANSERAEKPNSHELGQLDLSDLILGDTATVGDFRVRSYATPSSWPVQDRVVTRQWTPHYPAIERSFRIQCKCVVYAQVDSSGNVVAAHADRRARKPTGEDSTAAFDSASVRAARLWTWSPGRAIRRPFILHFDYLARPIDPNGEGSVLLVAVEGVSGDTIQDGDLGLIGKARDVGTISIGHWWTRFRDLPAGPMDLLVENGFMLPQRVNFAVRAGKEDTVTVVLKPRSSITPGHSYWTHPPAAYEARPEDDGRYPLADFSFRLETDRGELVDTVHGIVTKDLVIGPDTTIALVLTRDELDRVRRKMIEIRLWDMPEPHPPDLGDRFSMPHTTVRLEASSGGHIERLTWDTGTDSIDYPSDNSKRLRELWEVIRSVVEEHTEYRALPDAKGMYL